jgi:tripartite-type tricarboxylate transporter receptor subunit TctC
MIPRQSARLVREAIFSPFASTRHGGPLDIAARTVAPFLSSRFGQDFVVENRPGASGNMATSEVVKAAPDGHTLLLCGPVNTINETLFENLDFKFSRDIAPVASIARVPLVVEVNPTVPVRTVPELLAFARDNPGRLKVAFAGVGTPQHIAIELFELMTGVKVTPVPYAGSAPALADLLRGEVDAMFDPAPSSMPHIRAGRLIALATTGPTRSEALPDVPILGDLVPDYEAGSWFGLGAPRDTPRGIVEALNAAVNAGVADQAVRARFRELGATVMPGSPAECHRRTHPPQKRRLKFPHFGVRLGGELTASG